MEDCFTGCNWMGNACNAGAPEKLTNTTGTILSPTFRYKNDGSASQYPNNAQCSWMISTPDPTEVTHVERNHSRNKL